MQRKAVIWTAVATTAAVLAIYYIRKRKVSRSESSQKDRQHTHVFTRNKGIASGEYTL